MAQVHASAEDLLSASVTRTLPRGSRECSQRLQCQTGQASKSDQPKLLDHVKFCEREENWNNVVVHDAADGEQQEYLSVCVKWTQIWYTRRNGRIQETSEPFDMKSTIKSDEYMHS